MEGHTGPKGLGGVRPTLRLRPPYWPSRAGRAFGRRRDAMFDVGYFPPNTPPTSVLPNQAVWPSNTPVLGMFFFLLRRHFCGIRTAREPARPEFSAGDLSAGRFEGEQRVELPRPMSFPTGTANAHPYRFDLLNVVSTLGVRRGLMPHSPAFTAVTRSAPLLAGILPYCAADPETASALLARR